MKTRQEKTYAINLASWVQKIPRKWSQSTFVKSVVVVAGGTAFGQVLVIAVSPILTRLYAPNDFGVLSVYSAVLYVLVAVASLRYEMAIPLPEEDVEAANVLAVSILFVLLISFFLCIIVLIGGNWIAVASNNSALIPYLWLLPIGLVGAGFFQAFSYWAIRRKTFRDLAVTKVTQSIWLVIIQFVLGWLWSSPVGLLLGHIAGQAGGSTTLLFNTLKNDRELLREISWSSMWKAIQRYKRFPLLLSWSSLLNTLGLQLPSLFLATLYGLDVAGWFMLSERVARAPARLLGQAIGQVFMAEASQLKRTNPESLKDLFTSVFWKLVLVGGIPLLILALISPWIFSILFGGEWGEAGKIYQAMSISVIAQFVVAPLSQTIVIIERQDLQMWSDLFRTVSVVLVFFVARTLNASYLTAIFAYSVVMFCLYFSYLAIYRYQLSKSSEELTSGKSSRTL